MLLKEVVIIFEFVDLTDLGTAQYVNDRLYVQLIILHMTLRILLDVNLVKSQQVVDLDQHEVILQAFDQRRSIQGKHHHVLPFLTDYGRLGR